jgi:DNA-binding NarL/FixJ family response regulator
LRAQADLAELSSATRDLTARTPNREILAVAAGAAAGTGLAYAVALNLSCAAEAARIDATDTAAQWTAAAAAHGDLDRPEAQAYCLIRAGAVQLRTRNRTGAAHTLARALAIARDLAALPMIIAVERLATLGGVVLDSASAEPTAVRRPPAGLTPRELEVLLLVVTGATNRRIARSLYISERTASVHVSNILAKLGATNRTEAARIAVRLNISTDSAR